MEHSGLTILDLWNKFCQMEAENDLLDRSVGGVFYWPLLRWNGFGYICRVFGLSGDEVLTFRGGFLKRIQIGLQPLFRDRNTQPWQAEGTFDTILIPFNRKQLVNGRAIDIFSNRLFTCDALGRTLVLDGVKRGTPDLPDELAGDYSGQNDCEVGSYDYFKSQALLAGFLFSPFVLPSAIAETKFLTNIFFKYFGIEFAMSATLLATRISIFKQGRRLARDLIGRTKPKRLIVVGNQSAFGMLAGAQDMGVKVIELQHGTFNRNPAYDYPNRPFVPYAPNLMLLFGQFWADYVSYPKNSEVAVIGAERYGVSRSASADRSKTVLAISPGPLVGAQFFDAVVRAASKAPDWRFVYRPHPWEKIADYVDLLTASPVKLSNFEISDNRVSFYSLLSQAELQIGVCSTGIYEGISAGLRTIVYRLPTWEFMDYVVRRGDAVLVDTPEEIVANLVTAPRSSQPEIYFAEPQNNLSAIIGSP